MTKEEIKLRFGTVAVKKSFVSLDQVIEALKIQLTENVEEEKSRPIGEILLSLGYMSESQIDEVLREMFGDDP